MADASSHPDDPILKALFCVQSILSSSAALGAKLLKRADAFGMWKGQSQPHLGLTPKPVEAVFSSCAFNASCFSHIFMTINCSFGQRVVSKQPMSCIDVPRRITDSLIGNVFQLPCLFLLRLFLIKWGDGWDKCMFAMTYCPQRVLINVISWISHTFFVKILEQILLALLDRKGKRDLLIRRDLPQQLNVLLNMFYQLYGILCFVCNNRRAYPLVISEHTILSKRNPGKCDLRILNSLWSHFWKFELRL